MDKYNLEAYATYNFEASFNDWYMESCQFLDDDHLQTLFDDSTPPHVEPILDSI
jgi:hypothetical protein